MKDTGSPGAIRADVQGRQTKEYMRQDFYREAACGDMCVSGVATGSLRDLQAFPFRFFICCIDDVVYGISRVSFETFYAKSMYDFEALTVSDILRDIA